MEYAIIFHRTMFNLKYNKIMKLEELVNEGKIFHLIAQIGSRLMEDYQTDLIYDTRIILNHVVNNEDSILFVAKHHSDTIERYKEGLKELGNTNPTNKDCLEYCQKTLGADFVVTIHPNLSISIYKAKNLDRHDWRFGNFMSEMNTWNYDVNVVCDFA